MEIRTDSSELWFDVESDYGFCEEWIRIEVDGFCMQRMIVPKGRTKICAFRSWSADTVRIVRIMKETQPDHGDEKRCLLIHGFSCVKDGKCVSKDGEYLIRKSVLEDMVYWHFDAPELYRLKLKLVQGEDCMDESEITFGFRKFQVQGNRCFLNGEAVRLCGTEWMPGSNPAYGMAESVEQLEHMLGFSGGAACRLDCNVKKIPLG